MAKEDKYLQETDELKEEIKVLKQSKKHQHNPKTEIYKNNIISEIKKREGGLCVSRGTTRKCPTNHCHQLMEQTMKTLSNYGEQLKTQLDFDLTQ